MKPTKLLTLFLLSFLLQVLCLNAIEQGECLQSEETITPTPLPPTKMPALNKVFKTGGLFIADEDIVDDEPEPEEQSEQSSPVDEEGFVINNAELEVRNDDNLVNRQPFGKPAVKQSVIFENKYHNERVKLYWISEDGDEEYMGDISIDDSLNVETYVGHVFIGKSESGRFLHPRVISINSNRKVYTFEPIRRKANASEPEPSFGPSIQQEKTLAFEAAPKPYITLLNKKSTSISPKFRSLVPTTIDCWLENNRGGDHQGTMKLGQEFTINAYLGHEFFFTDHANKNKVYGRFTLREGQVLYVVYDPENPPPQHYMDEWMREEKFNREYYNRTGIPWIHYFGPDGPRKPPVLHMWEAKEVGQKHQVISDAGYWNCLDFKDPACHSVSPIHFDIEVISVKPKAFLVKNFFTDAEAEGIINYAAPRMRGSSIGDADSSGVKESDTRTSRNAWLPRRSFEITETLFHRAEQILNISRLDTHNCEDMQVVHYTNGQKYDAHHDWGVSGYPESRYITLLLYLNDMANIHAGGETSFPKGADGKGFKVHPGKGNAVFFYDLLEDGNGDECGLHAALPVVIGEKWLANFWVWDPKRH